MDVFSSSRSRVYNLEILHAIWIGLDWFIWSLQVVLEVEVRDMLDELVRGQLVEVQVVIFYIRLERLALAVEDASLASISLTFTGCRCLLGD